MASTFAFRIDFIGHKSRIRRTAHTSFCYLTIAGADDSNHTHGTAQRQAPTSTTALKIYTPLVLILILIQSTFTHGAHALNMNEDGEPKCSVNFTIQFLNETRLAGVVNDVAGFFVVINTARPNEKMYGSLGCIGENINEASRARNAFIPSMSFSAIASSTER